MLKQSNVEITTLSSGLKIAYRRIPNSAVEYCGVVVRVGSRDDAPDAPGMAHFVEHTIFKGTERRSSWHIINRMERVGGELNAYTSKEETVVYTAAPAGSLVRSIELIADLICNSRFPDSELDKEREVVADEINSYLDTPSDAVYDDFEELVFPNYQLKHNILGNIESLSTFDSQKCRQYLRKWYTSRNMSVFYCGSQRLDRVAAAVEKYFCCLPDDNPRMDAKQEVILPPKSFCEVKQIGLHQAHTVMGTLTPSMFSSQRFAYSLLTNILGGPGMNSLLNVALREKRGLVYSVEASTSWLTDCGLFTIYFGSDPDEVKQCIELALGQIDRIANDCITPYQLRQAKKQYIGQLAVASDNKESISISGGRAALYFDHVLTAAEQIDRINSITTDDIRDVAQSLTSLSILTLQ